MDCGLLPISHEAVAVGEVNFYTLSSYELTKEDRDDIASKCKGIDKVHGPFENLRSIHFLEGVWARGIHG